MQTAEGLTDVRAISRIAYAFMGSKALFAALDLNLFDALAEQPRDVGSLSAAIGVDANRLATLLAVLQSLGLIVAEDGRFANAPATDRYLVRHREEFFGDYYRLQIDKLIYPLFLGLTEGLQGRPSRSMEEMLADPEQASVFTDAQHQGSSGPAVLLSRRVDLTGRRRLLDVAGGSGAFSIVLCRRFPQLHATVMDFASVVGVAGKYIADAGLADRISTLPGDALRTPWPDRQDIVLMSYLLSAVGGPDIPKLLRLAFRAMEPGGLLLVHDFMLDRDRAGPRDAAQFFLGYVAQRTDSVSFSAEDVMAQAELVGFVERRSEPLVPGITSIVIAAKPR